MGQSGEDHTPHILESLLSTWMTLTPEAMLQRLLHTACTEVAHNPDVFLLIREGEELRPLQRDPAIAGPFQEIMGFPFTKIHLPLDHVPQLREALPQPQPIYLPTRQLPELLNGLITPEQAHALEEGYGYQCLCFTPLTRPEEAQGFLVFPFPTEGLAQAAAPHIQALGALAAIALELRHLQQQSTALERRMAALHAVSLRVSRSLDLEQVLHQAADEVAGVLNVDAAAISVIEPESDDLVIRAQHGLHKFAQTPVRIPRGVGVAWDTLLKREVLVRGSWADEPRLATPEFLEEAVNTTVLVPMLAGGEPVGVLSAMHRAPRRFTTGELHLLTGIADQVAVALINARLHAETRRQSVERAFLFNLAAAIAPLQDVTHIARESLHRTLDFLGWPTGAFLLEDAASGALVPQSHLGEQVQLDALIAQLRESLYHLSAMPGVIVSYTESAPRTIIQIPMQSRRRTWGWLVLGTPEEVEVLPYVREVLNTASSHLGIAVENVRLYQEMTEREYSTRALYQITRAMTGHDLPKMLEQTLNELHQGIPYEIAGVLLTSQPTLEFLRLRLRLSPQRLKTIESRFATALGDPQAAPLTFSDEQRILIQGEEDGTLTTDTDHLFSYLEAPIMQDEETVGAVLLARRRPFHAREQRLLFILAYQLSKVLTTIRLYHQAREQATQLQEINALLEVQEATQIELFDDIAHELRNPITFMQSYPELLLEGALGELNPAQQEALEVLQQQAQLLSRLAHDLGSMKVIDRKSLQYRQTDLGDLLRKAAEATQITARQKQQRVQTNIAPDLPRLWVDPERILQVVGNLLGNAIKFTPSEGTITLTARREEEVVHVAISDTGPGIPEEELTLIFKRLYQGRLGRKYPGMGIGLALSQHIVETHGGAMGVHSQVGEGSTFYFTLPTHKPD